MVREHERDEREQMHQRVILAARASGDLICDWDVAVGTVIWVGDDATLATYGISADGRFDEWKTRLHPGDSARVTEKLRGALASEAERWSDEYRLRRRDGTYAVVSEKALIVRSPVGSADRVVFVLHDVSDRHAAEDRLQRLHSQVIEMSQVHAMTAAATILAHELNQTLTAAANYIAGGQLIVSAMEGDLACEALHDLEDAGEQIQRAGEIIRRMRLLNIRDESTHRSAASLAHVASDTQALLKAVGSCRKATIKYELKEVADQIDGDPVQLGQVLMNLIRNACEAGGPAGSVEVVVSSRARPDGRVEIRVRDNGPGIPEDLLRSLFTGLGVSTTGRPGLGLPVSAAIVESLGGSLWAENNADGGASFYFTVPVLGAARQQDVGDAKFGL